jgi:4-hydroxybenzoate polyprenyltransferase
MGVHFTWIRERERMRCFKAFLHNNYVGLIIFVGIVLDFLFAGGSF